MKKYIYKESEEYIILQWTGDNNKEISDTIYSRDIIREDDTLIIIDRTGVHRIPVNYYIVIDEHYHFYDCRKDLSLFLEV